MDFFNLQNAIDKSSQDVNKFLVSLKEYLQSFDMNKTYSNKTIKFLSILDYLSTFMKDKSIIYIDFKFIGLILFNDRILIDPLCFSSFANIDKKEIFEIISSPEFFCRYLTQSQYMSLVKSRIINGCIFDWRVLRYPECELSQKIIANIFPSGGESFYLSSNDVNSMICQSKAKCEFESFQLFDIEPVKNDWNENRDTTIEEILENYADPSPSGKCWLLLKSDKSK